MSISVQSGKPDLIAYLYNQLGRASKHQPDWDAYFTRDDLPGRYGTVSGTADEGGGKYIWVVDREESNNLPVTDYTANTPAPNLSKTSIENPDNEMALLTEAAEKGDETAFLQAANSMDWHQRTAFDYIQAIRMALLAGAYKKASKLAYQGAEQFSDDAELVRYANILAPPKILQNSEPPDPKLRLNRDWLVENSSRYRGRWVALKAGELLAVGESPKELVAQLGDTKRILLTKVY